jgi:DNA-binding transcriptional ArsR family regulator
MIRIRLPVNPPEHVAFSYSPLLECVLSLHVLVGPKHHALHHGWVRAMRGLDPAMRRRIDGFRFVYGTHLPDMLVPSPLERQETFEEEVERFCGHPPDLLIEEFGRPLFDHAGRHGEHVFDDSGVRETMLRRAAKNGQSSLRLARLLLDDPQAFALEFARLLEDYWESTFANEWEHVDVLLSDSIVEAGRLLATLGIWAVLGRLPPHCRPGPYGQVLEIDLPHEHTVAISGDNPLVLSPSVFVWPHLRVNCDGPWPTALVYSAPAIFRNATVRMPPAELTRILRALADDTRLRVLRLIADRPRTTQEIAPLVGLSMSGASKCIRLLSEAGLITGQRDGYYVVYRLAPNRIATLTTEVTRFLAREESSISTRWSSQGTRRDAEG